MLGADFGFSLPQRVLRTLMVPFKGILKGVYKGSIIGFYIKGQNIITYTILDGSSLQQKYNGQQNPILKIKPPMVTSQQSNGPSNYVLGFRIVGMQVHIWESI